MTPSPRSVLLFESVSAALLAEKILKGGGIPHKVIPVPKHISSDCGVCIRINDVNLKGAEKALDGRVKVLDVRQLP